jgi:lantibiotic biosynthesis protein
VRTAAPAQAPPQSLAKGAAGIALLHVEHALNGSGTWAAAHAAITAITAAPVDASTRACLYYGAPALALVVHAARADGQPRYEATARMLGQQVELIARHRLASAQARMAHGIPGTFNEHDLIYGLAGLGALLLRTAPGSDVLGCILRHLTRLLRPLTVNGMEVPGWWSDRDPDPLIPTPGGHANLGMAHGVAGILALLSLAASRGVTVTGQHEAIRHLAGWLARWRQEGPDGPWWPQWLTRDDIHSGHPAQPAPGRPSWCYGTPGIARALQLAAIAVGGRPEQEAAEADLAASLSQPSLARFDAPGLCHGIAGVYVTAARTAQDAITPAIGRELPRVAALLARQPASTGDPGLLTGDAGTRLALESAARCAPPLSGWDACLLIT